MAKLRSIAIQSNLTYWEEEEEESKLLDIFPTIN